MTTLEFLVTLAAQRLVQTANTNESNDAEDRPDEEKQDQEDDERCFHEQGVWQGLDHSQLPDTTGLALAKMGQIRQEADGRKVRKDCTKGQVLHNKDSKETASQNETRRSATSCLFSIV